MLNYDGKHELDASIMDGKTRKCGAVAGVTTVKNPITLGMHFLHLDDTLAAWSSYMIFFNDGLHSPFALDPYSH